MFRLGLGLALTQGAYAGLHPFSAALIARMSVAPSAARAGAIDKLVRALIDAGIWSRLDLLHMLAAHDSQAARLNWITTAYDLVAFNSPSFRVDRGFKGDGAAAYLRASDYNPAAIPSDLQLNNASAGLWVLTPSSGAGLDLFTEAGRLGRRNSSTGDYAYRMNDGTTAYGTGGDAPGLFVVSRADGTTKRLYRNGALAKTDTATSTALSNKLSVLSTTTTLYSDAEVAAVFAGANLTDAQHAALYAAVRTYLITVGAIAS